MDRGIELIAIELRERRGPERERLQREQAQIERHLGNVERAIPQGIFPEITARLLKDLEARRVHVVAALRSSET